MSDPLLLACSPLRRFELDSAQRRMRPLATDRLRVSRDATSSKNRVRAPVGEGVETVLAIFRHYRPDNALTRHLSAE